MDALSNIQADIATLTGVVTGFSTSVGTAVTELQTISAALQAALAAANGGTAVDPTELAAADIALQAQIAGLSNAKTQLDAGVAAVAPVAVAPSVVKS